MNEGAIRDRLVEHGRHLLGARRRRMISFSGDPTADELLNDLVRYPHAFVLACIMDRQIKAERAWLIPHKLRARLGGFSISRLGRLSRKDTVLLMSKPENLHRFPDIMGGLLYAAVQRIIDQYDGDAARIWKDRPTSAEVVYRFLEFDGAGPKIASMAVNILARDFKIRFADYYAIDISADVHVRRVFGRLGLCPPDAKIEQIIYKARALYPKFPGIMDLACWEIGRNWCKRGKPACGRCYMNDVCGAAQSRN